MAERTTEELLAAYAEEVAIKAWHFIVPDNQEDTVQMAVAVRRVVNKKFYRVDSGFGYRRNPRGGRIATAPYIVVREFNDDRKKIKQYKIEAGNPLFVYENGRLEIG